MINQKLEQPPVENNRMGPTEYTINPEYQREDNGHSSSVEDIKAYQHARNMTGVVGDSKWHSDVKVNEIWEKFSVAPPNGNHSESWQKSIIPF